jgi:superfamily II DNA or RNA helicase
VSLTTSRLNGRKEQGSSSEFESKQIHTQMDLRPYQSDCVSKAHESWLAYDRILGVAPTGCHALGQKILMHDGSVKKVELVNPGDLLMGPDSLPRIVLNLCRGEGRMFKISPIKGREFTVNEHHVLSLIQTDSGKVTNVSVQEYLSWSKWKKHIHKLYRSAVEFEDKSLSVDPYFMGVLIGDGSFRRVLQVSKPDIEIYEECLRQAGKWDLRITVSGAPENPNYCFATNDGKWNSNRLRSEISRLGLWGLLTNDKFIPQEYKTSSMQQRLELLAGLIDTDGSMSNNCYDWISASPQLAKDVEFLVQSVGLSGYLSSCRKSCQNGFEGIYYRICINGDTNRIPCRIPRKKCTPRKQKKSVLRTGFSVEYSCVDRYYGFNLDGDSLYLMNDFTVTHNSGKTRIFSALAKDRMQDGKVLILAHREELIDQAIHKLHRDEHIFADKEKAEHRAALHSQVVVGSVQTLMGARKERWGSQAFDTVVCDEAHHALADSYRSVLDYFQGAQVLGVTATPDRGDRQSLGHYFQDVAFEIGLLQLINEEYLCKIVCKTVPLNIDLTKVRKTAGDFNAADLGSAVDPILRRAAQQIKLHAGDRKTLVFLPLVQTAVKFSEICGDFGLESKWVSGESKDRKEILDWFATPGPKILCNSMLLTEGYDEPSIDCIVCLRPTQSRALYSQIIGRGTRIHAGKENLLILDFLWNVEKHQLVKAASLVARDAKEAERIDRLVEAGGGEQLDLLQLKDDAEEERLKEIAVEHEREASLRRQLEKNAKKKGRLIDPVEFALSLHAVSMIDYEPTMPWHSLSVSPEQSARIEKAGIDVGMVRNRGHASVILDTINTRRSLGLATLKQVNYLIKTKHPSPHTASFVEASAWLDSKWGKK